MSSVKTSQGMPTDNLKPSSRHWKDWAGCDTKQVGAITGQSGNMVDYYAREIDQERLAKVAMDKYAEWTKTEQKSGEVVKYAV